MSKLENELVALKNETPESSNDLSSSVNDDALRRERENYLKATGIDKRYAYRKRIETEIEKAKNIDLRIIPEGYYETLQAKANEIRVAQSSKLPFITPKLTELVSLSFPSLITIGANSGSGKTTAAANITFQLYKNGQRVLILSNEELSLDVLDRISCMELGYDVNKRSSFSEEQNKELDRLRPIIGEFVRVIDTAWAGNPQLTSSIEGIQATLHSLTKQEKFYDCIILDYYQKVTIAKEDPSQLEHATLQELSNILDHYYKLVKAPIIVMCQLRPTSKECPDFEKRIKAGKSIMIPSTYVLELQRVDGEYASDWICHKDRWGVGNKKIRTLWERGKFKDQ